MASAVELSEIRQRGTLRHLGIPYANFVRETAAGVDGLDVELIQAFAKHLGLRYEWVNTTWTNVFGDLTGQKVHVKGDNAAPAGKTEIRGDIIANGLTLLPWREKLVSYSLPTFPTGVWLVARADSPMKPIEPSGKIETDIQRVMAQLPGRSILAMKGTCLDPDLYDLPVKDTEIRLYTVSQNLSEMAPAIIDGAADATLLDIPDVLIALQKWPGEIKVIGPVSTQQIMGAAVDKSSVELLHAFNDFFKAFQKSGEYKKLVEKYYPAVFLYLGDFFNADGKK
jgi:ABC-type amino acid transport substrate-binding protein